MEDNTDVCEDIGDSFNCRCLEGWKGQFCEEGITERWFVSLNRIVYVVLTFNYGIFSFDILYNEMSFDLW